MASLPTAQRDQLDTAARVAALRTLAPVPAAKLARHPRPRTYRGALTVAAVMGVLIALTWLAPLEALDRISAAVKWLELHATTSGRVLATTLFLTIGAMSVTVAWARSTALGRAIRLPSGAHISVEDVATQLEALILQGEAVTRAQVRVDNLHRRGVRVAVRLHVAPNADLNRTIETVCEQTEWFLHAHLLVRLSSIPSVELSFDELELRSGRVHDGTAHAISG